MDAMNLTIRQLNSYYEKFRETRLAFNKKVIEETGLVLDQVRIKCRNEKWPCILYSTSLSASQALINGAKSFFNALRAANNRASLRLSFRVPEKTDPLAFFIPSKVNGFSRYSKEKADLYLISLTFTQKPPDDFIEIIGYLLDLNSNSQKRREERIIISQESARGLGLASIEGYICVENGLIKCIVRDLSFSGARALVANLGNASTGGKAILHLAFDGTPAITKIPGKILRHEEITGRSDFASIAISFEESEIPLEYKRRINNWLSSRTHAS